jgi:NACHT domain
MKLVSDVERHKSTLSLALSADTVSAVLRALGDLQELKTESQERHRKEAGIALNQERIEVLSALKYVDPSSIQGTNWRLHQPGTGIWFIESGSFKTWFARKNSNLWLRGIAGAGKSILTSLIVHEVQMLRSENVAMAYFYCDYKDTETQEALNVLGSLARQLAVESEKAFEALKQFLRSLKSSDSNAKLESGLDFDCLKDLIRCLASAYDEAIIIVDGLDECGENCSTVIELLHSINDVPASNIKVLLTSRDIIEIRDILVSKRLVVRTILK